MYTFKVLCENALRYYDLASETEGSDIDLVKAAINAANAKRSTEEKWKFMLSSIHTLSVVAQQQEYILPLTNLSKLQYLYSPINKRFAQQVPVRQLPYQDYDFNSSVGSASLYYELMENASMVAAQPPTADTITLTSTDVETADPELYIVGEDANGVEITTSLGKGDTSSQQFTRITYYAKTADFVGTLSLTTTGGTTLLTLTNTEYAKQYPILRWMNIPQVGETFTFRYFKTPRLMTRDFDIPDLPFPHSGVLVYDALLDAATYNELDSESVNIWRDKQQEFINGLYMLKLEGDTVAGIPNSVV